MCMVAKSTSAPEEQRCGWRQLLGGTARPGKERASEVFSLQLHCMLLTGTCHRGWLLLLYEAARGCSRYGTDGTLHKPCPAGSSGPRLSAALQGFEILLCCASSAPPAASCNPISQRE